MPAAELILTWALLTTRAALDLVRHDTPGAYSGRWPHIHLEIYDTLSEATSAGSPIAISQIALPESTCAEVYATAGYEASVRNLAQTSLTSDIVFGDNVFGDDGGVNQLGAITGSVESGLAVTLAVGA